uniref:Pumilio homolog 4 n=1 Tax=Zeugodacus cucurbitae TaxID=28588 RepID=A0A0A1WH16_ZEUCU
MAAADFEQISSEMVVPLDIPRMRTVSEELAFCQLLFHNRNSRKVIEPIYERKLTRVPEEQQKVQERRRERHCLEKKIKARRSPSLPPTPFTYMTAKNSPRSANFYRK